MTTVDFTHNDILSGINHINGIFVSVGSGMGALEQFLNDKGKIVLCVDPSKETRDRYTNVKRVRKSDYPFVKNLIEARPNAVGNCNLMLIYPLPDYGLYDVDSIRELRPQTITVCCSIDGKSGSWFLHRFLRKCGVRTTGKSATDENLFQSYGLKKNICPVDDKYEVVSVKYKNNTLLAVLKRSKLVESREKITFPEIKHEAVLRGLQNIKDSFQQCLTILSSLHQN